jgi:hypothetical protein
MKQSEAFHKAQLSVLNDQNITFEETLEILKVLMHEEGIALFTEKKEEERKNGESV